MAIRDEALKGRIALVTGGSRGIGRAICIALAARGAHVIVNYASRDDAAHETVSLIEEAGGQALISGFDVSDAGATAAEIKRLGKELGGLDIVVNNAGIAVNGLFMRFKADDWQRVMDVNVTGAFNVSKAAVGLLLKAREHGRIIQISSVIGEIGNAGQAAYAASKAALFGLTKSLAKELAPRGVCVNAVAPGYIATDMTAAHLPEEQQAKLVEAIPLGRVGDPQHVADAVAFLAGPEAAYITGQVLRVNGGLLM